jgi:hypothetical protein
VSIISECDAMRLAGAGPGDLEAVTSHRSCHLPIKFCVTTLGWYRLSWGIPQVNEVCVYSL